MILNQANSRSILQVWFSTGWSMSTLKEFYVACNRLLGSKKLPKNEADLVRHWLTNNVTLTIATNEWFKGIQRRYEPVVNFKHEIDRVDYIRYLFTGCIFEERNVSGGNRTMFSIPTNLGVTKIIDENFYFMFDLNGDMLKYKDSLKISVDKFMLEKMEMLKKLVRDEKLEMSFELGFVSRENSKLIKKIQKMNPYTIDWSNIPDYLTKEDFLAIARKMSGAKTVHYIHFMNWVRQLPGTDIRDYDRSVMKVYVQGCLKVIFNEVQSFQLFIR